MCVFARLVGRATREAHLCSWQSNVSNALLRPAEMYHGPVSCSGENLATSASFFGTGHAPSSCRCGTHCNTPREATVRSSDDNVRWTRAPVADAFEGRGGSRTCLSETAHLVNASTAASVKSSPHLIWHSLSSGRLVQVLMQSRLARHVGDVATQRASGAVHLLTTHLPMAAPSVAAYDGIGLSVLLATSSAARALEKAG